MLAALTFNAKTTDWFNTVEPIKPVEFGIASRRKPVPPKTRKQQLVRIVMPLAVEVLWLPAVVAL